MFEDSVDDVEEFSHGGDESAFFGESLLEFSFVEGFEYGVPSHADKSGHVKGASESPVALFGDAGSFAHRGAGFKEDGIESGIAGQLSR